MYEAEDEDESLEENKRINILKNIKSYNDVKEATPMFPPEKKKRKSYVAPSAMKMLPGPLKKGKAKNCRFDLAQFIINIVVKMTNAGIPRKSTSK
jgi:hypothetical protein